MRAREFIIESTEREIAQIQYMQGECAVLALTIRNMNPQRFTLGFVYEFFDSSPDMYLEPDEFDELDPARQQDIQYSYQNWTLTHAYVYDVLTREYIDAEGRHKQLPMIGRDFNSTRHNKFPAETQDLVNVSHYMEYDEAQEKWIVLQGWAALDKAYTPEDKQRAREYAIKYLGIDPPAQAVAEDQETYLSPNMSVRPNQDPDSPEQWDYHYKGQQIKPGDKFHPQIKDLHLRQIDPTYDAIRNAFDNPLRPGPAVPEQPPQGDTIIPARPAPSEKIKGPDGIPVKLKDFFQQDPAILENFADGRHPEDKGDSKRLGVPTKSSVSNLRKFAKNHSGRAAQLAHWMANMKSGKRKNTNETTIGHLQFPQLTVAIDDHAVDRTRTRGINPHAIDQSLKKLNNIADQLAQVAPNSQVWAYDPETQLGLGMRRISSQNMLFKLKTVVNSRPFDGPIPIIDLS